MKGTVSRAQYDTLMRPLNATRIARRSQGGKQLSYLESWDVRAHLIRVFGFGNFDAQVEKAEQMFVRDITVGDQAKPGIEVAYLVTFTLTIYTPAGERIATFTETAVGSATGSVNYGDLHDNAVKQGASDALKRCAINLGSQFGLSLYDNGSTQEVVRGSLVVPETDGDFLTFDEVGETDWPEGTLFLAYPPDGPEAPGADLSPEQAQRIADSLGAVILGETPSDATSQAVADSLLKAAGDTDLPETDPSTGPRRVQTVPTGDRT